MTLKILTRKTRFFFWLLKGFFVRHSLRFAAAACLIVFTFLTIKFILPKLDLFRPTYTEAIIGQYKEDKIPDRVLKLLSHGLTKIENDGTVSPDLATSWDTQENGKIFTFYIKKGLNWNDGTPLNGQNLNIYFDKVKTVYQPDYLKFELEDAFSPFPAVLSKPVFKKGTQIGMGLYKLEKVQKDNLGYISKVSLWPIKSSLPKINFNFYPTRNDAVLALKLGEVEAISDCPPNGDNLDSWPNLYIKKTIDSEKFVAVFLNTQNSLLSTKEVRQALDWAIEKNGFSGQPALGPISSKTIFYNPATKNYNQDIQKAQDLLKDIPKEKRKITLTTMVNFQPLAERIASDWRKIDFQVKIQKVENFDPTKTDYQALLAGQKVSTDPDQYTLWHSTQDKTNISRIKSPKIDKLLEDGRKTIDLEKRKTIYQDLQKALADETPAIFLYNPESLYIVKKNSKGEVQKIMQATGNFWPN